MSFAGTILSGALDLVAIAYPPAATAIGIAKTLAPYLEASLPLVRSAVQEGPAAFAAAKKAAPELFRHMGEFASALKGGTPGAPVHVTDHELANLTAHVAGIDPPGWTHAETQAWWNRASGAAAG